MFLGDKNVFTSDMEKKNSTEAFVSINSLRFFKCGITFDKTQLLFCSCRSLRSVVWRLSEDTNRPARHSVEPVLKRGTDIALDIDLIVRAYLMWRPESSFHEVCGAHVLFWNISFEARTTKGMFQKNLVHISRHFLSAHLHSCWAFNQGERAFCPASFSDLNLP